MTYEVKPVSITKEYGTEISMNHHHLILHFTFPSSLYLKDLGDDMEMKFVIKNAFFDKYFSGEEHFFEERFFSKPIECFMYHEKVPLCFAVHTNLLNILFNNNCGFQRKIFIESYLMLLIYQNNILLSHRMTYFEHWCDNKKRLNEKMKRIKCYLDECFCESQINLHQLSSQFDINNDLMCTSFKDYFGVDVYTYILQKKWSIAVKPFWNPIKVLVKYPKI